jgi:heat shock protein HslJ
MPAVLLVVLACACGDDAVEPGESSSPTSVPGSSEPGGELDGREVLATGAQGFEIVGGTTIRLAFERASVRADAGCNHMSSDYEVVDGVLHLGSLGSTAMACDPPLMDQDERLATFLMSKPAVELDGDTLTLTSGRSVITLLDREVADPDRPLEGTRWVLDTIVSGDSASSIPTGITASLTISDGTMRIDSGCNTGSAPVGVRDHVIDVGRLTITLVRCSDEQMEVERAMVDTLQGSVSFTVEAARLTLTAGDRGLSFVADQ